jgi:hypothetical protein
MLLIKGSEAGSRGEASAEGRERLGVGSALELERLG